MVLVAVVMVLLLFLCCCDVRLAVRSLVMPDLCLFRCVYHNTLSSLRAAC